MNEQAERQRTRRRGGHDFAYLLGEGASVGRSRTVQNALSVAPLVLINALLILMIYAATVARGLPAPRWENFWIVAPVLMLVPGTVALVLVSLRDHEQPITVATFVTGVTVAVAIAVLSALRLFISYTGVLIAVVPTVLLMIVVMLRLKQAQAERVALLNFPGADVALARLGNGIPVVGSDADLSAYDRILIDVTTHHSEDWSRFLLRSYMRGVVVTPWVQFLETRRGRVDIASFDLADVVLQPGQILYSRAKRLLDLFGVVVAFPFALIAGITVGLYILVRAGRPVFFKQQRRGLGGRNFTLVKFRTMRNGASSHSALDNDVRVVPGLRLVRRFRLDEIPQLYNIWRGDMSWIGPRPATVEVAEATEAVEPKYASRLLVRPGLSGWAQVNSGYASTVEEEIEKLGYDLYYVKRMSLDLDLLIIARTARIVLFRSGAK